MNCFLRVPSGSWKVEPKLYSGLGAFVEALDVRGLSRCSTVVSALSKMGVKGYIVKKMELPKRSGAIRAEMLKLLDRWSSLISQ